MSRLVNKNIFKKILIIEAVGGGQQTKEIQKIGRGL